MITIHNPRDIIDEGPIHNVPKIMDWNGAFIMQGKLWMARMRDTFIMSQGLCNDDEHHP